MKKEKLKLKNLYWNEFLRSNFECVNWIKHRIQKGKELCRSTINKPALLKRMDELLEKIDFANTLLKFYRQENKVGESVNLGIHWRYHSLFKDITTEHSDVLALFLQALMERFEEFSDITCEKPPDTIAKTLRKAHYFRIPDETKRATQNIIYECKKAAYGTISEDDLIIPSIAHWPYAEYKFIGPSSIICLPPYDRTKLCHWAILAHEIFHSKLYTIERVLDDLVKAELLKDEKMKEKNFKLLDKLLPSRKTYNKLTKLRESIMRALKIRTGEEYRMLYKNNIGDDFYIPYAYLKTQFSEIICDIAAVFVAGPSYVAVACSSAADNIRQPYLDVSRHLYFDLVHPPDVCRVLYQIETLDKNGLCLKGERIEDLKNEAIALTFSDMYNRRKKEVEKHCEEFLKFYIDTITDKILWKDILEVVDLLVDKRFRYNQERWDHVVNSYEKIIQNPKIELKNVLPFDFVNMVWLKLLDISEEGLEYEEYCKAYEKAKVFFNNVWKRVCRLRMK